MVEQIIKNLNFVFDYLVNEGDMSNFQDWLRAEYRGAFIGGFSTACLSGLKLKQSSGLNFSVTSGVAVNEDGRMLYLEQDDSVAIGSPGGNPARTLVVLRPLDIPGDPTPEPLDPGTNFDLTTQLACELVVINGIPAATPVYPTPEEGDVILAGFLVPAGASSLNTSNEELYVRQTPRRLSRAIRQVASTDSTYTLTEFDEIVEVANAQLNLPADPTLVARKRWVLINKRTAGNAVLVNGNGSNVSGQASLTMDDRWSTLEIYSNGVEYVAIL